MKKFIAIFGMIMLIAFAAACTTKNAGNGGTTNGGTTNGGTTGGGNTAEAEQLYTKTCQVCHGVNLAGGVGPSLAKVGSLYKDADELKTKILKGSTIPGKSGATGVMTENLVKDDEAKKLADWLITKK